jgi:hypothetical protein
MKRLSMKKFSRFLTFAIVLTILGSCSLSKVNSKLVIGNWQYEKMGPYISKNRSANPTGDTISTKESLIELKTRYKDADKEEVKALRESMYKGFSFREDKTVTVFSRGYHNEGTWKLNFKGNKIVIKDSVSQKHVIQIFKLDSLNLVTVNPVLDGSLQRIYGKRK